jgi:hypothetical protein
VKKASATHKPMGETGSSTAGIESGISEVQKVGKTQPEENKAQRPKPQMRGSIAKK